MAKKQELFLLIKALNKAEKRYVKLFASLQRGEKGYLRLFDAIDSQDEYDERALRQHFEGEAFLRQFHVPKNYLYQLILKALRNYNPKLNPDFEIQNYLQQAEILFQKGIFTACEKELAKAEKLATTYEKAPAMLDIISFKRKLDRATLPYREANEKSRQELIHEKIWIQKQDDVHQYWHRVLHLFSDSTQIGTLIAAFQKDPFFNSEEHATTLQAQVLYYHLHYAYAIMHDQDVDKGIQQLQALLDLLESKPHRIAENPSPYFTAVNNMVASLLRQGNLDSIPPLLAKIKEKQHTLPKAFQELQSAKALLKSLNTELEYYRDARKYEDEKPRIDELEKLIFEKKELLTADQKLMFYYQFACLYFMGKDLKKALWWVNCMLNEKFGKTREDIQSYARLMNLAIHFELKNIVFLRYAIAATRRFLLKKRQLYVFEEILLKFFSNISMAPEASYPEMICQLEEALRNENLGKDVLDYFDFFEWINRIKQK